MAYYYTMQLHIAVCDDEKTEREYLAALVRLWAGRCGYALNLNTFDSAESFLFAYDGDKTFDILLLDIQMRKMDGVELAKRVRQDNSTVHVNHERGTYIGNNVTIGHNVVLHACTIEDGSMIGIGSVI